jgi:tRNA (cytidine/uridine-2'-O-)-methyltransferase
MKVVMYQPEIVGNVGTIIRMCACLSIDLDIIEPCGFPFDKERLRRTAMDYFDKVKITRYSNFDDFRVSNKNYRIVLLTTKSSIPYYDFKFNDDDILMVGRESAGVPDYIHKSVNARIVIPMKNGTRCLNVAMSLAIVTGEVMKQCNLYEV